MKYKHLSHEERSIIGAFRHKRYSLRAIAHYLGRSPSTISREIRRNNQSQDGRYRAENAQSNYTARKKRTRRGSRFEPRDWKRVERLLRKDHSPEQVAGRLKKDGLLLISHETIYRHIWMDWKYWGTLHTHLRGRIKQRRKRYGSNDSRGRLRGKTMINERPQEANDRSEIGHWEVDTVHGKGKEGIVTIVDRMTGYVMIGKIDARSVGADQQEAKVTYRTLQRALHHCHI